jgi:hypothetical protein
MYKIVLSILLILIPTLSSSAATLVSSRNTYFASTDRVYSELYDNKLISESVWKALLNQTHYLFFTGKLNPKAIYIASLNFASDIMEDANVNSSTKSIKDGYYALSKEIYYGLYMKKYITQQEYDLELSQTWEYIYNANSTPRKIYNTALEFKNNTELEYKTQITRTMTH